MKPADFLKAQKAAAGKTLKLAVALGVFAGLLLVAQAWYLAQTVNAVVFHQATLADVTPWLLLLLAIMAVRAGLVWASEQVAFRAAATIKLSLRDRLYSKLQQFGPVFLRGESAGDMANTLADGIEALEAYYARYLPAMSLVALVPLSMLVFVVPVDWWSGVIMLVTAPLIPLFMILIGLGAEKMNQKQWRSLARMSAHFLDMIQGLTTLKLFNASKREAETVAMMSEGYRQDTMKVLRIAFLSSLVLEFFATVSIALVAVLIGFRLFWGELNFLPGFFVLLLAPEFYLPLRNMGTHYHARMEAIGAAERMVEILDADAPSVPDSYTQLDTTQPLQLSLQQVSYRYDDQQPALDSVSLTLAPGETVAIVGPSGAGKSTLLNLLMGFIQPQQGELLINDLPLQQIDPQQWRSQIAWVPQKPRLFKGSIQDNITLGKADASPQEVLMAAQDAQADEFIQQLPDSYQAQIGEGGAGLSGGQIQRIALARAFLKNAPLVFMDEPTASLDAANEQLVSQAIQRLSTGRTVITIAHRLATIRHADRILVMQQGRIVAQGTHDSLMAEQGLYAQLVRAGGLA